MKLSICMMVKNEEKYLDQCLSSVRPLLENIKSELIIVDTGSDDTTVEIAKKYTDKVYFSEWDNDFASMRNKTISYAKGEWILILDGDEIIEKPEGIYNFVKSAKSRKYNAAGVIIKNITKSDDETKFTSAVIMRLFKNVKGFRYEGAIHEQPQYKPPACSVDTELIHYGYISDDQELMDYKYKRNMELLERELEKDPENIYYWYQVAQSHGMYKDYKKSLEASLKAYEIAKEKNIDLKNRMYIYIHLALAYFWNENFTEMEKICNEAMHVGEGYYLDLHFFMGYAKKNLNKKQEAIEQYERYIKLIRTNSYVTDSSITNITVAKIENAYFDLSVLYYEENKKDKALKYFRKLEAEHLFKLSIPYIITIYVEQTNYEALKKMYDNDIRFKDNKIKMQFWTGLESKMEEIDNSQKNRITELFSRGDCDYAILSKARLWLSQGDKTIIKKNIIEEIEKLDFDFLPIFFADLLFLYVQMKMPLDDILDNVRDYKIQAFVDYVLKKYENVTGYLFEYIQSINIYSASKLSKLRVLKIIEKYTLLQKDLHKDRFEYIWNGYLEDGVAYISQIYHPNIIENELIYDVKDEEDAFLIYMYKAKQNVNSAQYIKYLRKALKTFPVMNEGIQYLIDNISKQKIRESNSTNNEFENLKKKVIDNVNNLMEINQLENAKFIVDEYLSMEPGDIEILLLKSKICLLL